VLGVGLAVVKVERAVVGLLVLRVGATEGEGGSGVGGGKVGAATGITTTF
jgi:hypothetical protein